MENHHLPLRMIAEFRHAPGNLWALALSQVLCFTTLAVVSYRDIKETARINATMNSLKRLHVGPIVFHRAFCSNIGQQPFRVIIF